MFYIELESNLRFVLKSYTKNFTGFYYSKYHQKIIYHTYGLAVYDSVTRKVI